MFYPVIRDSSGHYRVGAARSVALSHLKGSSVEVYFLCEHLSFITQHCRRRWDSSRQDFEVCDVCFHYALVRSLPLSVYYYDFDTVNLNDSPTARYHHNSYRAVEKGLSTGVNMMNQLLF